MELGSEFVENSGMEFDQSAMGVLKMRQCKYFYSSIVQTER